MTADDDAELILSIARRAASVAVRRYRGLDRDDAVGIAALGALTAARRYDGDKGGALRPWLYQRATGAIVDAVRDAAPAARTDYAAGVRIHEPVSLDELHDETGHDVASRGRVGAWESGDIVARALAGLDGHLRVVAVLHLLGYGDTEIAAVVGLDHRRVLDLRRQALAHMRERVPAPDDISDRQGVLGPRTTCRHCGGPLRQAARGRWRTMCSKACSGAAWTPPLWTVDVEALRVECGV
jgi:RNA polymerase sigma factor (sigma-70 family)